MISQHRSYSQTHYRHTNMCIFHRLLIPAACGDAACPYMDIPQDVGLSPPTLRMVCSHGRGVGGGGRDHLSSHSWRLFISVMTGGAANFTLRGWQPLRTKYQEAASLTRAGPRPGVWPKSCFLSTRCFWFAVEGGRGVPSHLYRRQRCKSPTD